MKQPIRTLLHYCKLFAIRLIKLGMRIIPKQKDLIIFSAWFGQKYQDNAMYMYEYMLENSNYKVIWFTRNKDIYKKLKYEDKPVLYSKSLNAIWKQIRAKMLVSAVQFADFNNYFLQNCIFFDLGHGFPNKQIGYVQPDMNPRQKKYDKLLRNGVELYMTAASEVTRDIQMDSFHLDKEHVVFCNKPRTDVLFDAKLRKNKNQIVNEIKDGHKAIVYMPTHRSCGSVEIKINEIFDLEAIQKICEKFNAVFIIKKHYYHAKEKSDLNKFSRIFDITNESIDSQTLAYQTDILVSDYSSAYIDYLLLDRPVILYTYDLDDYLKKERGLYLGINDNHVGYKPCTKDDFTKSLEKVCFDWSDAEHKEGRNELRRHYFDDRVTVGNTRKYVMSVIDKMMKGTYSTCWDEEGGKK